MRKKHVKKLLPLLLLAMTTSVYAADPIELPQNNTDTVWISDGRSYHFVDDSTITTHHDDGIKLSGAMGTVTGSKLTIVGGAIFVYRLTGETEEAIIHLGETHITEMLEGICSRSVEGNTGKTEITLGDNSTIQAFGFAIVSEYGSSVTIGNDAVITSGGNGYGDAMGAVRAVKCGKVNIGDGAYITNKGEPGPAHRVDGNKGIVAYGADDIHGVGTVHIGNGATIETEAMSAYNHAIQAGVNIRSVTSNRLCALGKVSVGNDAKIFTQGTKSHGLYSAFVGSTIDVGDNATIITQKSNARGIQSGDLSGDLDNYSDPTNSGGKITIGKDLTITTKGESAHGVCAITQNAEINIDEGATIQTVGTNANAVYASDGGTVEVKGGTINAQLADVLLANGKDDRDDKVATIKGIGHFEIIAHDSFYALHAKNDGIIDLTLNQASILNGSVQTENSGKTDLTFADNSLWKMTGTSHVSTLTNDNSIIDMTQDGNKYNELQVVDLAGDHGTIIMNLEATENNKQSDIVNVSGTLKNTQSLTLMDKDTGNAVGKGGIGTVLATTANTANNAKFIANDGEGALSWYRYELGTVLNPDDPTLTDWFLKAVTSIGGNTPSVDVIMSSVNYHTWRNENDKLMKRMGELRLDGSKTDGVWARIEGNKIGRSGNSSFENKYKTYELGYDKLVRNNEDHTSYVGAAFTYTDGASTYDRGNGDNNSKSLSLYATDIGSKGHYLDLVFKVSSMDNDFKVYDTYNDKITGDYTNTGVSLSAEYGRKSELKHGWYIEPQGQLTIGHLRGDDYTTSNNIHVAQDSINSFVARAGFNIGKQIGTKGVVYAKANLLHEFGGGYNVSMRHGSERLSKSDDFDDTWFEYGVGTAFRTSNDSSIYMDLERSTGSDYKKDWQWNVGARWMF